MVFDLPEFLNSPFTPFLVGICVGYLITVFVQKIAAHYINTHKKQRGFGAKLTKDDQKDTDTLNYDDIMRAASEMREMLALVRSFQAEYKKYRPTMNSVQKKMLEDSSAIEELLFIKKDSVLEYLGRWENTFEALHPRVESLQKLSKSDALQNIEYKYAIGEIVSKMIDILKKHNKA